MFKMVDLLEIIAEPNRRKILQLVWDRQRSAGDIARQFDTTFGAVSQHLHVLRTAGLLDVEKAGRSRIYRVRKESLGPIAKALEAMWWDALDRLKSAAEAEAISPAGQNQSQSRKPRRKKRTKNE